jgi:predicted nucleic acid-binding protein
MRALVVDASVVLAWCFPDEHNDYANRILDLLEETPAVVPSLWFVEVANALLVGERRNRLNPAEATRFLSLLRSLMVEADTQTSARALTDTLALARAWNLSAYDATYLELAMREGLPLATLDDRLREAATGAGVEVLG